MNILAIYPAFDPTVNEMAMVWRRLCETTNTRCTVLANLRSVLKAHTSARDQETIGNLNIHRFPSIRKNSDVMKIASGSRFDLIFCAVPLNMDIALKIQRSTGAPIVLHVEYFLDDDVFLNRREYFGVRFLRPYLSERKRQRLHGQAARILCSNPAEFADPRLRAYPRLAYLPWPAPSGVTPHVRAGRQLNGAAYIGSLSRGKGAATLFAFFESLLTREPEFQLHIVGPAMDALARNGLAALADRFPGRVRTQLHVPREEALKILSESLFVFSPGHRFGWGLMADAWGTGTPVLALEKHYELKDNVNCLVVKTPEEFVKSATRLRDNAAVWGAISAGGLAVVREHAIDRVAEHLHEALVDVPVRGK